MSERSREVQPEVLTQIVPTLKELWLNHPYDKGLFTHAKMQPLGKMYK